jgi:hypothetical protein
VASEKVYVAHWEGPFPWEERGQYCKPSHVLYALHGAHHLYGRDVLLYIGKSDAGMAGRLRQHDWVADEYDAIQVRLASVGPFESWASWSKGERYPKAPAKVVSLVESLLIYAHQPAYNAMSKGQPVGVQQLRVFNTGRVGHLHPEVSGLYHFGE